MRTETTRRTGRPVPSARARRSIAISGTTPEPPPTSRAGASASQVNQPPIGPRTSSSSPTTRSSWRKRRHLAVVEPLDGELELAGSVGGEATEYERDAVYPSGAVSRTT